MKHNNAYMEGRLAWEPEQRFVSVGNDSVSLAKMRILVFAGPTKSGQEKPPNGFYVEGWGEVADAIMESKKGDMVCVKGTLCESTWTDKETGKKRSSVFVKAYEVTPKVWEDKPAATSVPAQPQSSNAAPPRPSPPKPVAARTQTAVPIPVTPVAAAPEKEEPDYDDIPF